MGVLLSVVLAVLLGLIGLVLLVLVAPVNLAFRFEGVAGFNGQIRIRGLFGLLRLSVPVPGASARARQPARRGARRTKSRASAPARAGKRGNGSNVAALLRQAAFRRRVYRLVRDLLAAIHLHQFALRARLGLGDPADTGRLWAFVGPLAAVAGSLRDVEVHIEPEFMVPACEFQAQGQMRLIPLQFVVLAVGFALSPASIRAWRTLRSGR